jgi:DNA-binding MarR family transcriptional regulator
MIACYKQLFSKFYLPDAHKDRVTLDTMPTPPAPRAARAPRAAPGPLVGAAPRDDETIAQIEASLYSLARRLKQSLLRDYIARQAGDDLDQAGMAVLYALHEEEQASLRVTDLAARLCIDPPAVTRKAQQLERLGLVSRSRDADDARASRLGLTPEGREVLRRFLAARHEWLATVLADWPAAQCQEFARLICRFADGIDRHLDELGR